MLLLFFVLFFFFEKKFNKENLQTEVHILKEKYFLIIFFLDFYLNKCSIPSQEKLRLHPFCGIITEIYNIFIYFFLFSFPGFIVEYCSRVEKML